MTKVSQSGDRVELFIIYDNRITGLSSAQTFQKQNIAFNMENCEKCTEIFPKKWKIARIMLKSQLSAQEC